jgi:hypothetical protein
VGNISTGITMLSVILMLIGAISGAIYYQLGLVSLGFGGVAVICFFITGRE